MADPSPGGFAPDEPTPRKSAKSTSTGWRDEAAARGASKTGLIVLTLFLIVAIGGAIAALLIQPDAPSDPLFVAVPIGEYPTPWPAPPAVYRDAALVTDSFPARGGRPTPAQTFNYQEKDKFEALLAWVKGSGQAIEGGPDDLSQRPLVLSLAGLAAVNGQTVYLLPANARPDDPSTWIPVSDILDAVAASKARKKFLILDLAYPTADPFGGTLRDDAAAQLDELLTAREKANGLPFVVLTSTGPGELSLPSYPLRHSGFAFYLAEGLRGAADGYQDNTTSVTDPDKTVTVGEVARFVKYRVERWARVVHERPQTPTIYGLTKDTDFMLSDEKGAAIPEPEAPAVYPDALKEGWDGRANAPGRDDRRPYTAAFARPFARLTEGLLRAERVWRESGHSERMQGAWEPAKKGWDQSIRASAERDPTADLYANALKAVAGHRLVVNLRALPTVPATYVPLREMMRELAIAVEAEADVDPTRKLAKEQERNKARENAKEKAKAWEDAVKDDDTRTKMLWEVIADAKTPTAGLTKLWRAELASPKVADRSRATSEVMLVSVLSEVDLTYYAPSKRFLDEYPHRGVAALLQAENALSRLLAAGPNGFALVAAKVKEGEGLRVRGQNDLFTGTREQAEGAHGPLAEAAKKFQEARTDLLAWQDASQEVEAATATLIHALPGELIGTQPPFERWRLAAEKTAQLAEKLSEARTAGQFRADQLPPALVGEVQQAEKVIRESFITPKDAEQPTVGLGTTRAKPSDLLPLERLVAATLVAPARRKAVWDAIQADALKFHTSARQGDATDAANQVQTRNAAPARLGDRPTADDLAARRGQASVSLLKLAGHPRTGRAAALVEPLTRPATAAEAARTLGLELREAWQKGLPDTPRAARVAPPGVAPYRPASANTDDGPGLTDARADVAAYTSAARAALEADRVHRGTTDTRRAFYSTALLRLPAK